MIPYPHNSDTLITKNSLSNKKINNTPLTNNIGISSLDHVTNNIGISSLDHVSQKESIEDKYPNFTYNFNSDILTLSEDEDYMYESPFNYYSSEDNDENSSSLLKIPNFNNDVYKM